MKQKKLYLLVTSLVLISLILAACDKLSSSNSDFPTGKFIWAGSEYVGIHLNEDKTWSGFYYGEEVDKGTYEVKGNLFTQTSEEASGACSSPATYEWAFDGTNLTFKLHGDDRCDIRRESFDGQTFILTN